MQPWTRRMMLRAITGSSLAAFVPYQPLHAKRRQKSLTLGFGT